MGFLELHLHEPNFTLNTGEHEGLPGRKHKHGHKHGKHRHKHGKHDHEHGEHDEKSHSLAGKLGPLLVLVFVIALARRKMRHEE